MTSIFKIFLATALCVAANAGQAAGLRALEVPADARGPALTGAVWSPCAQTPGAAALGPITLPGVLDCPIPEGRLPLVVISHGRAGLFASHHDTAAALADAAVDHFGDNARDPSRTDDVSVMVARPAGIQRLIDHLLGPWPLSARVDPDRIGFFGFSRGGYTGLVLLGATPDWNKLGCNRRTPWCAQRGDGVNPPTPLARDARIKAAVIVDPLADFFSGDELAAIKPPVFLWASERGGAGVTPEDVARVASALPPERLYRMEPNTGHFAFLAPCSPGRARTTPELCVDAPGFDREAFHKEFNAATAAFFKSRLQTAN